MIDFKQIIAESIAQITKIEVNEIKGFIEVPKEQGNGDYAFPCFKLAKALRKSPNVIADDIKANVNISEKYVEKIEVVGGYLNFFVNKETLAKEILQEVDENEDKMISRNLTSALLGDKIVCVGYAVIFSTLLNRLGIACDEVFLRQPGKKVGHARNVIRIKDDKYNVDGIYYFDPTWNSKKNKFDNNFMFSYRYFALTKEQMDDIDKGRIVDEDFPYFSNNMAQEFKKQVESVGLKNLPDDFVKSINFMALLVNGDSLFSKILLNPYVPDSMKPNKDNIYESLLEIEKYFIKPIPAETLIRVLFNVRKQEYYNNPEKYTFALIDFCKTVACSHWDYEGTPVEKLMMQLAETSEDKMKVNFHQSIRVANENNIPEQIEQVKLTRTLRSIYEQKINK